MQANWRWDWCWEEIQTAGAEEWARLGWRPADERAQAPVYSRQVDSRRGQKSTMGTAGHRHNRRATRRGRAVLPNQGMPALLGKLPPFPAVVQAPIPARIPAPGQQRRSWRLARPEPEPSAIASPDHGASRPAGFPSRPRGLAAVSGRRHPDRRRWASSGCTPR
jgi:hypothetical protein